MASQEGHAQVVLLLLEAKASVNRGTGDGTTPLHLASQDGQEEVVSVLLAAKATAVTLTPTLTPTRTRTNR